MKIIKEGKKLIDTMEVTCKKCSAVLEISSEDLIKGLADRFSYTCPCCRRSNELSEDMLTEEILFNLRHFS